MFKNLGPISPKSVFLVENKRNEHHYQIPQIWISLGTKFHLKHIIFIFWAKLARKLYSRSKRENLDITIKFSIFESI